MLPSAQDTSAADPWCLGPLSSCGTVSSVPLPSASTLVAVHGEGQCAQERQMTFPRPPPPNLAWIPLKVHEPKAISVLLGMGQIPPSSSLTSNAPLNSCSVQGKSFLSTLAVPTLKDLCMVGLLTVNLRKGSSTTLAQPCTPGVQKPHPKAAWCLGGTKGK